MKIIKILNRKLKNIKKNYVLLNSIINCNKKLLIDEVVVGVNDEVVDVN
jgi:hypothetical protein